MQGKILIVDAIATNRIVLKVKLTAAFYDVIQAASADEALQLAERQMPALIICAASLVNGSAVELAQKLQAKPCTASIPILVIGSRPDTHTKLQVLAAGANDVMLKPVDDSLLLARVRSLIRAHNASAEWQMRDDTSRALGFAECATPFKTNGQITLVSADPATATKWVSALRPLLGDRLKTAMPDVVLKNETPGQSTDVFVLAPAPGELQNGETLRLLASVRANAATRHAGILVLQSETDASLGAYALDLGADDLMTDGFDPSELSLRIKTLLQKKRIAQQLRATVRTGLRAAVFDPLTGLHNRRYAMPHLARVAEHAMATGRSFAVMIADMDHFKRINDQYGHASGDAVLVETANRLRRNMRAVDLVARIGGEEFLIVMPTTPIHDARLAASRLCQTIGDKGFDVPGHECPINVTVSIGLAIGGMNLRNTEQPSSSEALLDAADKALYGAKVKGRNQFTLSRPAA